MTEEIIDLNASPYIGVFGSIGQGFKKLFTNFKPFLKMLKPILLLGLSCFLMLFPVFIADIFKADTPVLLCSLLVTILGLGLFIYSFWQFLLGLVAVSYLAKDIYENKPLKNAPDYYGYVRAHGKSFIKYWLWMVLIPVLYTLFILGCLFADVTFVNLKSGLGGVTTIILLCISLILLIFTIPFTIALKFAILFWAYNDKTKPLDTILKSIKACYKKWFSSFAFVFLTTAIFIIAINILALICSLILYKGFTPEIFVNPIPSSMNASITLILYIFYFMLSSIIDYMIIFISTRYYFELIKEK